jgi:glycosyltransferase involved in cell wall biosynthesis
MNIGIDIKAFKNGTTGIVRYLANMMDCLQEIDSKNEYFLFECGVSGYQVHNPRWRQIPIPHQLTGIVWQQLFLPYHLRKHRIDVLWAPEQTCPALKPRDTRIVTTVHDLVFVHHPETCRLRTRVVFSILSTNAIKQSDVLIAVSEFTKRDILRTFRPQGLEGKIHVIPCGKPDWQLPAGYTPNSRKDYLFFAGNLEPRKNLVNLVRSLEVLKKRGLRIELRLAGPRGWKNRKLFDLLEHSSVRDQITCLGYLDERDLKSEYLRCKAFVYPSIYEGFGIPILEALCLDCLVLTSRGTVMEEIAGGAATYFDPRRVEEIVTAIEAVYAGGVGRSASQQESRARVLEAYSWPKAAESLLNVMTGRVSNEARES